MIKLIEAWLLSNAGIVAIMIIRGLQRERGSQLLEDIGQASGCEVADCALPPLSSERPGTCFCAAHSPKTAGGAS